MAPGNNIDDAKETYSGFVGFIKWGTIACAIATIFVVLLIAS